MKSAELRLRQNFASLLEALKRSPAMAPYVHDLRVLLDPMTKSQRIEAAVKEHVGALARLSTGEITGALQGRLAALLTRTSLEDVPCDKAIRVVLVAMKKDGTLTPGIPRSPFELGHSSAIRTT